jgi:hypothetical protein
MRLDYRLLRCSLCATMVPICSHCDRGQSYCGRDCSDQARRQSLREAGRRYQATDRGRRQHSARQARYLMRREAAEMTHQGTPAVMAACTLAAPAVDEGAEAPRGWVAGPDRVQCAVCGSWCRPFGRWNFLRRRRR